MAWKSAGRGVLRWGLWLLLLWVLVRGIISFLPPVPTRSAEPQDKALLTQEPAGLRAVPEMFVREYLTWTAGGAEDRASRLRPFLARTVDRQAGWAPAPDDAGQQVDQTWVYGVKQLTPTRWLVTVAARVIPFKQVVTVRKEQEQEISVTEVQPQPPRTVYLAVPVGQSEGGWSVYDLPSLLPPPAPAVFDEPLYYGQEISDEGGRVQTLLTDFFKAYLTGADVTYYLAPGTAIGTITGGWSFQKVAGLRLLQTDDGRWALADVTVQDPSSGAAYTHRYTVKLTEQDGRWYLSDMTQKGE